MGAESPNVIIYDVNGQAMSVSNGAAIPAGTSALMVAGSDGTNSRYITIDTSGNLITFLGIDFVVGAVWNSSTALNALQYQNGTTTIGQLNGAQVVIIQLDQTTTLTGGVVTFQGTFDKVNWVTVPAAQVLNPNTFVQIANPYTFVASTNQPFLIVTQGYIAIRMNLTTVITGTGSVTPYWSTSNISPQTLISGTVTANQGTPNTLANGWPVEITDGTNVLGTISNPLQINAPNLVEVTQGTSPWVVAGNGVAGANPPSGVTYIGALAATSAPSLTNGRLEPLSLNLQGGLRIDGVSPTGSAVPADAIFVGGEVQALQSSLTAGVLYPLSLTTAALLRVDGSNVTQPVSAVGNFNNVSIGLTGAAAPAQATYIGALATSAATAGLTNGDMYPLNMTTTSQLRIDGVYVSNAVTSSTPDMMNVGGQVTTSSPTYTTAQTSPLSLTTAGALRVDGSAVTQPVSGTVTANQGTANTLANAWTTEITDGTHGPVSVTAASTSAISTNPALVVSQTPNLPLTNTTTSVNINASTNGNNTLVAGVAGKTVRVFKVALVFSAGGTVIFQDGNSTALSGPFILNAGATIVLDMDITNPWFLTSSGNAFVINLSGGAVVGGVLYYTQS
jgi:hypothetical protein